MASGQKQYTEKPHKVMAEQYSADPNEPEPAGVCHCTENPMLWTDGRSHVHTAKGMRELVAGDWIVEDPWTPTDVDVLSAEEFEARFGQTAADAGTDILPHRT